MSGNSSVKGTGQTRRNAFRAGAGALALAAASTGAAAAPGAPANGVSVLDGLEEWLGQHVIGQERVIAAIAAALRRWYAERSGAANRVASFLFLGPAHMGKTLLAKKLAERLFGSEDAFTRVDMRTVYGAGSWASHVAGAVRARPRQLVLLDEVHAGPPGAATAVRQMLETGRLSEGPGKMVDLRGAVVAATAAQPGRTGVLAELGRGVGETVTFRRLSPEELGRVQTMMRRG